jgi:4,5:9,10-diseco-3-hydroxy-5,9,17-trioxoandrosta-1(10),2-diene-4-oate hydrolase
MTMIDVGDGLQIHALDVGKGPVVVFLHGSGPGASGWSNFKGNFPIFAERGFRAIVPDTLGFGRSSKPEDRDYGMDFLAGALRRALAALGVERCAVVGNSHGGALAIQLALDHPALVDKLVLMAPGGLEPRETYMQMPGIKAMIKLVLGRDGLSRAGLRDLLALQLHDPRHLTDELLDERLAVAQTQPKRVLSSLAVPHLAPRLGELQCPIFGLWGMNDQFIPTSGALTLAACRRARVLLLSECGHWVMVEHAALFNRLCLDFLEHG